MEGWDLVAYHWGRGVLCSTLFFSEAIVFVSCKSLWRVDSRALTSSWVRVVWAMVEVDRS